MLATTEPTRLDRTAVRMLGPAAQIRGFVVQYLVAAIVTVAAITGVVILSAIGATIPEVLSLVVMAGVGYLYGAQQATSASKKAGDE
jgi:hypothetical protein